MGEFVFTGEYFHNLDNKGRIIIPAKYRELFGDKLIITRGLDNSLSLYTMEKWQEKINQILEKASDNLQARSFIHALAARASECSFDGQGRISISSQLLNDVNLTKYCAIIGNIDHVEIWDKTRWLEYYQKISTEFDEFAQRVGIFNL